MMFSHAHPYDPIEDVVNLPAKEKGLEGVLRIPQIERDDLTIRKVIARLCHHETALIMDYLMWTNFSP